MDILVLLQHKPSALRQFAVQYYNANIMSIRGQEDYVERCNELFSGDVDIYLVKSMIYGAVVTTSLRVNE